jgi:hypothetical protein
MRRRWSICSSSTPAPSAHAKLRRHEVFEVGFDCVASTSAHGMLILAITHTLGAIWIKPVDCQ